MTTGTVVMLTSNVHLLDAPGNVLIAANASGLTRDSVVNVSQICAMYRKSLAETRSTPSLKTGTPRERCTRLSRKVSLPFCSFLQCLPQPQLLQHLQRRALVLRQRDIADVPNVLPPFGRRVKRTRG